MKSEVQNIETTTTYPYLGVYSDNKNLIVLFSSPKQGTCISKVPGHEIGDYREDWAERDFIYMASNAKVILSN
jgi:hypothetical protein